MGIENNIETEIRSIEISSEDGLIYWQKKFKDGTVGVQERTGVSTADQVGLLAVIRSLEDTYGEGVVDRQIKS